MIKQNKRLDDLYKAGLILIIIGCSFTLLWAVISFFGLIVGSLAASFITSSYPTDPNIDIVKTSITTAIIGVNIIIIIASLPALITLLFAVKSIKYQTYKYKIICGIMGVVFGLLFGIIGGIFLLVSSKKDEEEIIIKNKNDDDQITLK
ncbi:hypothetical protein JLS56_02495 [Mycoplasma mycoides subsp. capri]|uniref:hypothetical protein n=1 Tax=Mycoplasma mycoides TaxID=2102 RepID=UPI001AFB3A09|nr:hypothetical protein JLS56_02495 [Mycoplasma mycoides subsp. capri]